MKLAPFKVDVFYLFLLHNIYTHFRDSLLMFFVFTYANSRNLIKKNTMTEPLWDLSNFYSSFDAKEVNDDMACITKDVQQFQNHASLFKSPTINGKQLLKALKEYEAISMKMSKLASFAYLLYATKMNNPKVMAFYQKVDEFLTLESTKLVFFTHSLNHVEDKMLQEVFDSCADLLTYKMWFDHLRLFKEHQLDLILEQVLPQKDLTGCQAWVKIYDQTLAEMEFLDSDGTKLILPQILEQMSSPNPLKRKEAAEHLSKGLKGQKTLITHVFNTLLKDKDINDSLRQYKAPWHSRHLSNQIDEDVVNALVETVQKNYSLCHRYYTWKAKQLGVEKINYWDRNAPLTTEEEKPLSWNDAKDVVFKAYNDFCPTIAEIGKKFFDNNWIDVPSYPGKQSGAFAHPTTPDVHPYLLLNYQGKRRDVMTLAHELGHGVHQYLANGQPYLLTSTPLTIAETASVFGEMLTFQSLLKACTTVKEKKEMLAGKIEDMINTVFRQVAFHCFEVKIHTHRKQNELAYDDFVQYWRETQEESLGNSVLLDPLTDNFWGYISHFIHAPFYVYAYAFGDCLVNSLYSVYTKRTEEDFQQKYIELLKAGGSKNYVDLLKPFHLNPKDPSFWQGGLDVLKGLIDDLEAL
jgi:oligoendopeptidase F